MNQFYMAWFLLCLVPVEFIKAETVSFDAAGYEIGQTISGVDGWVGNANWIVWGPTFDGSHGMWNNAGNGQTATQTYRDFGQSIPRGSLVYQIRPNATEIGYGHWLLVQDRGGMGGYALQLATRRKSDGVNTPDEFYLYSGNLAATSPDDARIRFISTAWYEVHIDFNVTVTPNGNYHLMITRLDGIPAVVWDLNNIEGKYPLSGVGRFTENGSTATAGFATLVDAIRLEVPATCVNVTGAINVGSSYRGDVRDVAIRVDLRNGPDVRVERCFLDANGRFTIRDVAIGYYDIAVKTGFNLRNIFHQAPCLSDPVDLGTLYLAPGDPNGDNAIDAADLDLLSDSWGLSADNL